MARTFRDTRKFGVPHNKAISFAPVFFRPSPMPSPGGPVLPVTTNPPYYVPNPDPALSGSPGSSQPPPPLSQPATVQTTEPYRYPMFSNVPFSYNVTPQLALSSTAGMRVYLMIVNLSTSQIAWVSYGSQGTLDGLSLTVPGAIPLPVNNGFIMFDTVVPQNDIYITGDGQGQVSIAYANMAPLNVPLLTPEDVLDRSYRNNADTRLALQNQSPGGYR